MMPLINTVPTSAASGDIKKGYDLFLDNGKEVPLPFVLLSASSGLFNLMITRNRYYAGHPSLSFELLAHIRYFVSTKMGFSFCSRHNKRLLQMQGADPEYFKDMGLNPDRSRLSGNEQQMLAFVAKAMDDPESITIQDMKGLYKNGWVDRDILDALAQGVGMIDHHILMTVFKMDV